MGQADSRPRFYIRQTMDGRFSWRLGHTGNDRGGLVSPGMAANEAIESVGRKPAVIFWEGCADG
jgi:hypothetical protein